MKCTFSVIIPVFNCQTYIGEAIASALHQEGVEVEVVVVDDGSTDATAEVAAGFGARVKVLRQPNRGISVARNNGAAAASGKFLAFLDADDLWLPEKLFKQCSLVEAGFPVVYSDRFNIGEVGDLPLLQSEVTAMLEGDIWEALLYCNLITTSSCVMDRALFLSLGGFREDLHYCEDWDLWIRVAEGHPVGCLKEPLLKYRLHQGGASRNYRLMAAARAQVVCNALNSSRGKRLPVITKKKIIASKWSTSGWEAARAHDVSQALRHYLRSLSAWPFDPARWYDVARVLAGRA